MTGVISTTLSNHNLAEIGDRLGFRDFIVPSPGHFGAFSGAMLATAVKAVIGAVWEDSEDIKVVLAVMHEISLA